LADCRGLEQKNGELNRAAAAWLSRAASPISQTEAWLTAPVVVSASAGATYVSLMKWSVKSVSKRGQSISTAGTNMTQAEKNAFAEALALVIRRAFGIKVGH
jgi:hypothetical protein